ncbi:MAG: signal peptide peptidase SppA [Planctomycetaceae bacterium]
MARTTDLPPGTQRIVIETRTSRGSRWFLCLLVIALLGSLAWNGLQYFRNRDYYGRLAAPAEQFHSGATKATERIALIRLSGVISPPYTGRLLKQIEKARDDEDVKGTVLVVDSPGGLVADSHQIYRELKLLSDEKPMFVAMKRIAASGGYYIAMGAGPDGKIFAEPTTWTGSIGVIIPRYNVSELAKQYKVKVEPLTTGPFKDTMSPFRDLTEPERELWGEIIDDAFNRFVTVIHENREPLSREQTVELATGQIYTAIQAKANGMIDEIGFVEDAIDAMKSKLKLSEARVVTYYSPPTILETVTGFKLQAPEPLSVLMDASVPRAMYLFSWKPIADPYDKE